MLSGPPSSRFSRPRRCSSSPCGQSSSASLRQVATAKGKRFLYLGKQASEVQETPTPEASRLNEANDTFVIYACSLPAELGGEEQQDSPKWRHGLSLEELVSGGVTTTFVVAAELCGMRRLRSLR